MSIIDYRKFDFTDEQLADIATELELYDVPLNDLPKLLNSQYPMKYAFELFPKTISTYMRIKNELKPTYDSNELFLENSFETVNNKLLHLARSYQLTPAQNDAINSAWYKLFLTDPPTFLKYIAKLTHMNFSEMGMMYNLYTQSGILKLLIYLTKNGIELPENYQDINNMFDYDAETLDMLNNNQITIKQLSKYSNDRLITVMLAETSYHNADISYFIESILYTIENDSDNPFKNLYVYSKYLSENDRLTNLDEYIVANHYFELFNTENEENLIRQISSLRTNLYNHEIINNVINLILSEVYTQFAAAAPQSPCQLIPGTGYDGLDLGSLMQIAEDKGIIFDQADIYDMTTSQFVQILREYDLEHPEQLREYEERFKYPIYRIYMSDMLKSFCPNVEPNEIIVNDLGRSGNPRDLTVLPKAQISDFITTAETYERGQEILDMCKTHYIPNDVYALVVPDILILSYDKLIYLQEYPQDVLINTLIKYEDAMYFVLIDPTHSTNQIKIETQSLFSNYDMWTIMISGRLPYTKYDETRYTKYSGLWEPKPNNIKKLYHVKNLNQAASRYYKPFEKYIIAENFTMTDYRTVAADIGMKYSLPKFQASKSNIMQLYNDNILQYIDVDINLTYDKLPFHLLKNISAYNAGIYYNSLSDLTIYRLLNPLVYILSIPRYRHELARLYMNKITHVTFFIPYNTTYRRCGNTETVMTLDDPNTSNDLIIGYGTLFDYVCYTVDDFISAWYQPTLIGLDPLDTRREFSTATLEEFKKLLIIVANNHIYTADTVEKCQQVIKLIDLDMRLNNFQLADEIMDDFNQLSTSDQDDLQELLKLLFEMAMYMRQWPGPGHVYPLKRATTLNLGPTTMGDSLAPGQVQINVTEAIARFKNSLEQSSLAVKDFINHLPLYEFQYSRILETDYDFGDVFTRLCNDQFCIRIASNYYTITSLLFLNKLFDIIISGADITQVDIIM